MIGTDPIENCLCIKNDDLILKGMKYVPDSLVLDLQVYEWNGPLIWESAEILKEYIDYTSMRIYSVSKYIDPSDEKDPIKSYIEL